jgi:hypothetical protein
MVEWTPDSLQEYFSMVITQLRLIIDEKDRRYEEKFAAKSELAKAAELATDKALSVFKSSQEGLLRERDARYEARFIAQEEALEKALSAEMRATEVSRISMDKRLDSMNEFRSAMQDQALTYLTRNEYSIQHKALEGSLEAHIINETSRVQTQEERLDGRLRGMKEDIEKKSDVKDVQAIKDKADTNSKWLFGMVAGLFVSIILTVIDLATRFLGG